MLRGLQGSIAQVRPRRHCATRLDPRRYNGASLVGLNGVVLEEPRLRRSIRVRERRQGGDRRGAQGCAGANRQTHRESAAQNVLAHSRHRKIPTGTSPHQLRISRRWSTRRRVDPESHRHRAPAHRGRRRSDERSRVPCRARGDRGRRVSTPSDIDFVLVGTTTPDLIFPNVACLVQEKLGIPSCPPSASRRRARDSSTASSSPISSCALGQARHALVIGAETMSRIIDWTDRETCVLFGDGAGAVDTRSRRGARDHLLDAWRRRAVSRPALCFERRLHAARERATSRRCG